MLFLLCRRTVLNIKGCLIQWPKINGKSLCTLQVKERLGKGGEGYSDIFNDNIVSFKLFCYWNDDKQRFESSIRTHKIQRIKDNKIDRRLHVPLCARINCLFKHNPISMPNTTERRCWKKEGVVGSNHRLTHLSKCVLPLQRNQPSRKKLHKMFITKWKLFKLLCGYSSLFK